PGGPPGPRSRGGYARRSPPSPRCRRGSPGPRTPPTLPDPRPRPPPARTASEPPAPPPLQRGPKGAGPPPARRRPRGAPAHLLLICYVSRGLSTSVWPLFLVHPVMPHLRRGRPLRRSSRLRPCRSFRHSRGERVGSRRDPTQLEAICQFPTQLDTTRRRNEDRLAPSGAEQPRVMEVRVARMCDLSRL